MVRQRVVPPCLSFLGLTLSLGISCSQVAERAESPATAAAPAPELRPASFAAPAPSPYDKPGFRTVEREGRIWVLREGSKELADFLARGEPTLSVTRPGAGPGGATLRAVDAATLDDYMVTEEGFEAIADADGRLWIFASGSEALARFRAEGPPTQSVTLVRAGPMGRTLRSPDRATLDAYLKASRAPRR